MGQCQELASEDVAQILTANCYPMALSSSAPSVIHHSSLKGRMDSNLGQRWRKELGFKPWLCQNLKAEGPKVGISPKCGTSVTPQAGEIQGPFEAQWSLGAHCLPRQTLSFSDSSHG